MKTARQKKKDNTMKLKALDDFVKNYYPTVFNEFQQIYAGQSTSQQTPESSHVILDENSNSLLNFEPFDFNLEVNDFMLKLEPNNTNVSDNDPFMGLETLFQDLETNSSPLLDLEPFDFNLKVNNLELNNNNDDPFIGFETFIQDLEANDGNNNSSLLNLEPFDFNPALNLEPNIVKVSDNDPLMNLELNDVEINSPILDPLDLWPFDIDIGLDFDL